MPNKRCTNPECKKHSINEGVAKTINVYNAELDKFVIKGELCTECKAPMETSPEEGNPTVSKVVGGRRIWKSGNSNTSIY